MSARKANEQEQITMGWPLSYPVLQELANKIQAAIDEGRAEVIGVHDRVTRFALIAHCTDRGPVLWECSGPLNDRQANAWIRGIQKDLKSDVAVSV